MFQQAMGGSKKVKKPEKQEEVKPPQPNKIKRPPTTFSTTPDLYRRRTDKSTVGTAPNLKNQPSIREKGTVSIAGSQTLSQSAQETETIMV